MHILSAIFRIQSVTVTSTFHRGRLTAAKATAPEASPSRTSLPGTAPLDTGLTRLRAGRQLPGTLTGTFRNTPGPVIAARGRRPVGPARPQDGPGSQRRRTDLT
jgi:hypothetical protein